MKKIFIVIFSMFFIGAFAQDYKEIIKNVPGTDKFPDASAINVFTKIEVNINANDSITKHVFYVKKVLNYKGKNKYSDVKLEYNANCETIKLGECFSVRDGKKISIPVEGIHDNGTYLSVYSPEYINQREKIVNFPAIEPNDFIVMDYTITSKPKMYFSGVEQMQESNPYIQKSFTITTDKKTNLYYANNEKINFEKIVKGNKIIYSWKVKDIPLIKDEKNKPSFSVIGLPIFYSVMPNWETAAKSIFKKFNAVNYNIDAVKKEAQKFANLKMNNEVKLQKLYVYLQENYEFKYSLNDDGFVPQEASKVVAQKFGSSTELTALFIAMAKSLQIDVKAVLVLGGTDIKESKKISSTDFISGISAYYNGKLINFDNQYFPFGFAWYENANLIESDNLSKIINYKLDKVVSIGKNIDITINNDKTAKAKFKTIYKNQEDFRIRRGFINETEKKRKIWFTSDISDKSLNVTNGPIFTNIKDYTKDLEIEYSATINNYYNSQDKYIYFKLPEAKKVNLPMTGKTRTTPYQVKNTQHIKEVYVFKNAPAGYNVIKPKTETNTNYKDDKVKMSYKISSKKEGNNIVVTREIFIPKTIVSVENYHKFYTFISEMQKPLNNMVFLTK